MILNLQGQAVPQPWKPDDTEGIQGDDEVLLQGDDGQVLQPD